MSALKRHLRTICIGETEAKTFSCQLCDSNFSQNSDLKRHKLNRHNKDGSAKFQCAICNQEFCNSRFMMLHLKEAHPRNIEKSCKAAKVLCEVIEDEIKEARPSNLEESCKAAQVPSEEVKEHEVNMTYYECEFFVEKGLKGKIVP